jgi:hypothetical protein
MAGFAAALAMPSLLGGTGAATGAAGMFSGLGGGLAAGGALLGGAGSLIGGLRGGADQSDYASLYATQLLPGNTMLTQAGNELAQLAAMYGGSEAVKTNALANAAYDQYKIAAEKERSQSGLQAGIASQYASNVLGLETDRAKAKMSQELLAPETAAALTKQYATTAAALQDRVLQGETSLLTPTATALAQAGLSAQQTRNKQVSDLTTSNLRIAERQEDTRNALALQRGQIEGQLALKRFGAGMALAGQRSFA